MYVYTYIRMFLYIKSSIFYLLFYISPHVHILLWLKEKIQPTSIDSVISAEIPDPETDPLLHQIVVKNMVHGPCGRANPKSPCMKGNFCSKDFPKDFQKETRTSDNGYPLYRSRSPQDGGFTASVSAKGREVSIDNRYIVPYSPILLRTFNAHVNVEICSSVKSIKYICKYINKGSDMAVYRIARTGNREPAEQAPVDEIAAFQLGRYISSNQAAWRIFGFPIHERYPAVYHLQVHLENGQRVYFTEDDLYQQLEAPRKTTLLAFFELCRNDEFARSLLYVDVPRYYTMDLRTKKFTRRKRGVPVEGHPGIFEGDTLGRVYAVHPSNMECFCLHSVRGPTSFDHLRTYGDRVYPSFRAVCQARGMLEDDDYWDLALREASLCQMPSKIRDLFVVMLATCALGNPQQLWENHKDSMSEDISRRLQQQQQQQQRAPHADMSSHAFNEALILIEDKLDLVCGKKLRDFGMSPPNREATATTVDGEMLRETSYDVESLDEYVAKNEQLLVEDQRDALSKIMRLYEEGKGGVVFVDSPGGTGKTFLINLLLAKVRRRKSIAVAVACSGIAATLLCGGRTAHSALKLPIDLARQEEATCNISKDSGLAQVLKRCELLVCDECTMLHKKGFEAVDNTLRDICGNELPFGDKLVVMSGDFRQTLPVVPGGTPADEIFACIKYSYLWQHVTTLRLRTNMRVHLRGDRDAGAFAEAVLRIGDGQIPASPADGQIDIPEGCCTTVSTSDELISSVYPDIARRYQNRAWLCERAILAPKNDAVARINERILARVPGDEVTYRSVDATMTDDDAVEFPVEFLNSQCPSGMPPHVLVLKKGAPVILLRNIEAPRLCNGTRLQIKQLLPHVIEATIMTGPAAGEHVFVPRIPMISSEMGFDFKRIQYPLKLCFAMSINKAQGQSLQVAGLHLETPCFSHGQLYVAFSRVGSSRGLFVLAPNNKTKNIVHRQVLD